MEKNMSLKNDPSDSEEKVSFESKFDDYMGELYAKLLKNLHSFFSYLDQKIPKTMWVKGGLTLFFLAWIGTGIYIVDQGNRGVVTQFGAFKEITEPGPHWHLPFPIQDVVKVNVEKQRYIEIGYRSGDLRKTNAYLPESLMLTGDENIVSVRMAIQYQINSAKDFLFNVKNVESTLKQVTESVQRGVVGKRPMDYLLTEGRSQVVSDIKTEIQQSMAKYNTGIMVTSVNLQDAQPPEQVQKAFEDAIRAREDKQRLINKAESYANEVIPKARGAASRMVQEALGYEAKVVAQASGEADRFDRLLVEYEKSPSVTHKRLYLEAKEKLFSNTDKVLVNLENGNNMLYLPMQQGNQGLIPPAAENASRLQKPDNRENKNVNKPKRIRRRSGEAS